MENNFEYLPLCWAAQRSGLYFTCISSRLTAGEVEYIVRNCGAKVLISSKAMGDVAVELASPPARATFASLRCKATCPATNACEDALRAMPPTPRRGRDAWADAALFVRHDGPAQGRDAAH